jgi:hypothetical protein
LLLLLVGYYCIMLMNANRNCYICIHIMNIFIAYDTIMQLIILIITLMLLILRILRIIIIIIITTYVNSFPIVRVLLS